MKGFDFMIKNYSLVDLMAITLVPIETTDDANRYVQAVVEISDRLHTFTLAYYDMTRRFLEYVEMYHNTKQSIYMVKALHIMSLYAEENR